MTDRIRDMSASTRWLRGLLILSAALSVVALAADAYEGIASHAFEGAPRPPEPDTAKIVDLFQGMNGLATLIALGVTFILGAVWIVRAARNAKALGARDLTISPGWAVGWYFVPIANLFKPFAAMSEIWRASADPAAWQEVRVPAILRIWWGLWLVSNALDLQVGKSVMRDDPTRLPTTLLALLSDLLDGANDLAFFVVVGGVWALQLASSKRATPSDAAAV